jgi:copper chaperone CopZ
MMNARIGNLLVLVAVLTTVNYQAARGAGDKQEKSYRTTLTIKGMHCGSCAKKVSVKLKQVKGVGKVTIDPKKGLGVIEPKNVKQPPSPRAQWEAVEKAGFKTVRLAGPFGKFDKKPRF